MTTVLAVYRWHGNRSLCVGVCDARCYNALQPTQLKEPRRNACICICGGANHGLGEKHALNNAQRRVGRRPQDLQAFAADRGFDPSELLVMDRVHVRSKYTAARVARILVRGEMIERPADLFVCEAVT